MVWHPAIREEELPPGMVKRVLVGELEIALFHGEEGISCLEDICTHDGGPLAEGDFDGRVVICPRHGARFDVRTGEALCLPAVAPAPTHEVRVRDGWIEVRLED